MPESPTSFCPVPEDQQPLNEYEQLKSSWLFNWTTQPLGQYSRKLVWVWVWGWVISGPIAAASFPPSKLPVKFALAGSGGALFFVLLVLMRLWLGWWYVKDRLNQDTVSYEESGWYDGQVWDKPPEVQMRDRLVVSYQIKPILNRLHKTLLILAGLVVSGSLIWLII
ncbi:CGLD27 family protein [Spirulina subsalsa FACHB-351]|uniref:CGLD27 family protein n=1 Tax=Spirulina subsalsa FACHB-351 TaxID=234711 RepID=A0ABT3L3B1_9CYAN|nr:CGLD27 family protein [Spirulina subsalsa]MCW6035589.1 CGLD27 family protein [Spirulina subsalsa FACHB-351]